MRTLRLSDMGLALVLGAAGVAEVWVPFSSRQGHGSAVVSTIMVVLVVAALPWRRSHPLPTILVACGSLVVVGALASTYVLFYGQFVPFLVVLYSVARHGHGRTPYLGAAVAAATLVLGELRYAELRPAGERIFHWAVFLLTFLAGWGLSRYEQRTRLALERAVAIEVEAAQRSMTAIVEERTRIARELHDVVAHAISVMVVQAGAAVDIVEEDPVAVRTVLDTIRTTGSGALGEMRRVVTMLRDPDDATLVPQPTAAALPALVDAARSAGLQATLTSAGSAERLPAGLDLTIYRIVQEALTNVRRHAQASRVDVAVSYDEREVRVRVCDDGVGAAVTEGGHGLIGMRERAALYGGTLSAASAPGGGFEVLAVLPREPS